MIDDELLIDGVNLEINYESEVYDVQVNSRDIYGNPNFIYIETYKNIDAALKEIKDIVGRAMGKYVENRYESMLGSADPDTLKRIRAWIDAKLVEKV